MLLYWRIVVIAFIFGWPIFEYAAYRYWKHAIHDPWITQRERERRAVLERENSRCSLAYRGVVVGTRRNEGAAEKILTVDIFDGRGERLLETMDFSIPESQNVKNQIPIYPSCDSRGWVGRPYRLEAGTMSMDNELRKWFGEAAEPTYLADEGGGAWRVMLLTAVYSMAMVTLFTGAVMFSVAECVKRGCDGEEDRDVE